MAKAEKGREKTNVMRTLEQAGIAYTPHWYDPEETKGTDIAVTLGESVECVFKTLVTEGPGREHFVFVIPVAETLDLKKAAVAVGEKAVSLIPVKEITALTGYVRGGCTPIGMKKAFPTVIHESARQFDRIIVSGGRIGAQIFVAPDDLARVTRATFADLLMQA